MRLTGAPFTIPMPTSPCPICGANSPVVQIPERQISRFACPRCGHYEITDQDVHLGGIPEPRHLLSAFLRERFERTKRPYRFEDRGESKSFPQGLVEWPVSEKLNRALLRLAERSTAFGSPSEAQPDQDWPLAQAKNAAEFGRMLSHWIRAGALENPSGGSFVVTGPGWSLVEELRPRGVAKSKQAFVAMSFAAEYDHAYDGIKDTLAAVGWKPWRADREDYQEKICDRIVAEIRRSGLMVAEFTAQRPNVYFEAGLAMGLGMPIIWCVRQDAMSEVAFDVRQYPYVVWSGLEELKTRLRDRIQALYPAG